MSELVERVVQALDAVVVDEPTKGDIRLYARIAIAAMREPLIKQLLDKRFTSAAKYHGQLYHDCIPELLNDVIDESLK